MLKVVGSEAVQDEVDGRSLLDEIAREGARRMLVAALETEVAAYLEAHGDERDDEGHALVVRNGKGRTRKITFGASRFTCPHPPEKSGAWPRRRWIKPSWPLTFFDHSISSTSRERTKGEGGRKSDGSGQCSTSRCAASI